MDEVTPPAGRRHRAPREARVVVVGAGVAASMAAVELAEVGVEPLVFTDRAPRSSNSIMAQGGLHLPLEGPRGEERMVADMLAAGGPEVDRELVRRFVAEIRPTVGRLEAWGLQLDRDERGQLIRHRAGGMSEARVVSCGDHIGRSLMDLLHRRLDRLGVSIHAHAPVSGLIPGSSFVDVVVGGSERVRARAVVVASGGSTFERAMRLGLATTNPANANAALAGMLRRLGLPEVGAGHFQYQPFGLIDAPNRVRRPCVPESVVAYGVRLLDRRGREVVAIDAGRLAITEAVADTVARGDGVEGRSGELGVRLTLSEVPTGVLQRSHPRLVRRLRSMELLGDDVVVAPCLHYQLGGFAIDADCSTVIPGVYLAGEIVGGIHGRDRLMGNAITDSLVHGRRAASSIARSLGVVPG